MAHILNVELADLADMLQQRGIEGGWIGLWTSGRCLLELGEWRGPLVPDHLCPLT